MPKSTSVESIDNVEHGLHLPGFSAMVPLYDTSFPLLVERVHAHNFVDLLCSSSEFLVTVIGSGVHHASYSSRHLFRFRYTICFFGTPVVPKVLLPFWVIGSTIVCSTVMLLHAPYRLRDEDINSTIDEVMHSYTIDPFVTVSSRSSLFRVLTAVRRIVSTPCRCRSGTVSPPGR
jgi:hypothetical protein